MPGGSRVGVAVCIADGLVSSLLFLFAHACAGAVGGYFQTDGLGSMVCAAGTADGLRV